jgi:hypothetical protein
MSATVKSKTSKNKPVSVNASENITKKKVRNVVIRPYPKAIFFYSFFVFSMIAYFIQRNQEIKNIDGGSPISWLSISWMIILFANFFAISFDFSTRRFFVWFLTIIVITQTLAILLFTGVIEISLTKEEIWAFNLNIESSFYLIIVIILGINLMFVVIEAQLHAVIIAEDKIILRNKGKTVFTRSLAGIEIEIDIPDVFKHAALGAGQILIIFPGHENLKFDNVPFAKWKLKQLNKIISKNI